MYIYIYYILYIIYIYADTYIYIYVDRRLHPPYVIMPHCHDLMIVAQEQDTHMHTHTVILSTVTVRKIQME